jgi:hypothetical protein
VAPRHTFPTCRSRGRNCEGDLADWTGSILTETANPRNVIHRRIEPADDAILDLLARPRVVHRFDICQARQVAGSVSGKRDGMPMIERVRLSGVRRS